MEKLNFCEDFLRFWDFMINIAKIGNQKIINRDYDYHNFQKSNRGYDHDYFLFRNSDNDYYYDYQSKR